MRIIKHMLGTCECKYQQKKDADDQWRERHISPVFLPSLTSTLAITDNLLNQV